MRRYRTPVLYKSSTVFLARRQKPAFRLASTSAKFADGDLKSVRSLFDLSGKNIIVTGGGRGIGYASVRAIAEMGGNVAILDVLTNPVNDLHNLSKEFGIKTPYIRADVTNEKSLKDGFDQAATELGSVDGLVTAAGISLDKPFLQQDRSEVSRILDINIAGTFFAAQLASEHMLRQGTGGSIVFIASVCSHVAVPGHRLSAYHASKGAVRILGKTLAVELAPQGVRINSVSPGYIESDMTRGLRAQFPHLVEIMHKAPPMRRIGNRNDLTGAIVYLLSDASAYTTGTDIEVTGGLHAGRIEDPLFKLD